MKLTEPSAAVTLRDVAAASGVSISTASRALDDRGTPSRSATAEHVRKVAAELGYRRNSFASNLRRGQTRTLGVLVPRLRDTAMGLIFEAIEDAASSRGYFAMVATTGDDPAGQQVAVDSLLDKNVDGIILANARVDDELSKTFRRINLPHALVLRTDGISPSAIGDDEVGGYLAVRHLIDLGHRDIGVIVGPSYTSTGIARRKGAQKALNEAGFELQANRLASTGYDIANGFELGTSMLGQNSRPTAIFAASDNLAIGVMSAAYHLNITVGVDLALVGYNDLPLASMLPVPLTSVKLPFDQMASNAVDMIVHPSKVPNVRKSLPSLIPRDSSGPRIS